MAGARSMVQSRGSCTTLSRRHPRRAKNGMRRLRNTAPRVSRQSISSAISDRRRPICGTAAGKSGMRSAPPSPSRTDASAIAGARAAIILARRSDPPGPTRAVTPSGRPAPLSLGQVQALPVPGHCEIGGAELELHPADGHTADGMAIWIPWARVLVAGDYVSPVEVPMLSEGGSRDAYIATLRRLEPLVDGAAFVVPGHGDVLEGARAAAILREDLNYLAKLPDAELPMARRSPAQRAIHAENVERVRNRS